MIRPGHRSVILTLTRPTLFCFTNVGAGMSSIVVVGGQRLQVGPRETVHLTLFGDVRVDIGDGLTMEEALGSR